MGELTFRFCVLSQMLQIARVANNFSFYPINAGMKRTGKTFWEFSEFGGRLWKGKVLAPFSSVVIYGLLIASSLLFAMLCVCMFENTLKMPKYGKFVMILVSVKNEYKVFILENISGKVFVKKRCFLFCLCEPAINNILPLLKDLSYYFPPSLNSVILPLVSRKPYRWMWRDKRVPSLWS